MGKADLAVNHCIEQGETLDPRVAVDVLRHLASDLRALGKATLLCRILLGRQLITVQSKELWRQMERRDYREDPDGIPVWLSQANRMYTSWYNFLEEGFERITGLHRQTAYSAIKLAHSGTLSSLSYEELSNFKRLANALDLVSAERSGVPITPELIVRAQKLPIKNFKRVSGASAVVAMRDPSVLRHISAFLKTTAARNPQIVNDLWAALQDAMRRVNEDPVLAVGEIVSAYFTENDTGAQSRTAQAS